MENINNNYTSTPVTANVIEVPKTPIKYPIQVDMKDLYSPEEQKAITARFESLKSSIPNHPDVWDFDMIFFPGLDSVVLNNNRITNHTVEIDKNGHAISVGSWHRTDLAGNYSDIIQDVKTRIKLKEQNDENKITNELDAMSELGKSQVKQKI